MTVPLSFRALDARGAHRFEVVRIEVLEERRRADARGERPVSGPRGSGRPRGPLFSSRHYILRYLCDGNNRPARVLVGQLVARGREETVPPGRAGRAAPRRPPVAPLLQSDVPGYPCRRGKVRDVYDLGDRLVIVATDRISAFDWVQPTPIPDKGRVLTALTLFWLDLLKVPNHLLDTDPRAMGRGFAERAAELQ